MQRKDLLHFIEQEKKSNSNCYFFIQILQSFMNFIEDETLSFKQFENYLKKNELNSCFSTYDRDILCDFSQLLNINKRGKHALVYYCGDRTLSIIQAAFDGDIALIRKLVQNGGDINIRGGAVQASITPLIALTQGQAMTAVNLQIMMNLGANIYFKDENNNTLLDHILSKEDIANEHTVASVKLLLRYGVQFKDTYSKYATGHNPFRHQIQKLLNQVNDSVELKSMPFIFFNMQQTLQFVPIPLLKIIAGYVNYEFYGYFFKNSPKDQLFLEDKKKSNCVIS